MRHSSRSIIAARLCRWSSSGPRGALSRMMRAFIQDLLLKTPRSVDVSAALHISNAVALIGRNPAVGNLHYQARSSGSVAPKRQPSHDAAMNQSGPHCLAAAGQPFTRSAPLVRRCRLCARFARSDFSQGLVRDQSFLPVRRCKPRTRSGRSELRGAVLARPAVLLAERA